MWLTAIRRKEKTLIMPPMRLALGCLLTGLFAGISANAATIAFVAPTVLPPGEDYLSPTTVLGTAGLFWNVPFVEWDQTGEVSLAVPVVSAPGDPGDPVLHRVFVTASNGTEDRWVGFELEVSGPATFTTDIPATIGFTSDPPVLAPNSLVFSGLDWEPDEFTPTIAFGLNVTPPISDEPIVLTLRPIPVPEPGTGILLVMGIALLRRRRGR